MLSDHIPRQLRDCCWSPPVKRRGRGRRARRGRERRAGAGAERSERGRRAERSERGRGRRAAPAHLPTLDLNTLCGRSASFSLPARPVEELLTQQPKEINFLQDFIEFIHNYLIN